MAKKLKIVRLVTTLEKKIFDSFFQNMTKKIGGGGYWKCPCLASPNWTFLPNSSQCEASTTTKCHVLVPSSSRSKWKWVLTTVKLDVFTKPDNGCFRFGIVNYTFEFNHFIFSNTQSGTGFDTFNLNLGWRHCKTDKKTTLLF